MYEVLLVDDKEIFCRSIARMPSLKNSENFFVVYSAGNGIEALDYLRRHHVDVVLTDIRMPLLSGIELLKIIRMEHLSKCTILISEFADFTFAKEGILNGAFDYLVKPVDETVLRTALERVADFLLQCSSEQSTKFKDLSKLVDMMFDGTEEGLRLELKEKVEKAISEIRKPDETKMLPDMIMHDINDGIQTRLPYAAMYIPLQKVCSIGKITNDALIFERIFNRAIFLQYELKKLISNAKHPMVQKVWHYTLQHIDGHCKLQNIAEEFYINKNYLSTLFKKETGINYKDFVVKFKIERAKVLLTDPNIKIYTIAETLQFGDPEYFGRVFKSQVGVSPRNFNYDTYLEQNLGRLRAATERKENQ